MLTSSNSIQLGSISISNFLQFNVRENDCLSGEHGDEIKKHICFLGSGRR